MGGGEGRFGSADQTRATAGTGRIEFVLLARAVYVYVNRFTDEKTKKRKKVCWNNKTMSRWRLNTNRACVVFWWNFFFLLLSFEVRQYINGMVSYTEIPRTPVYRHNKMFISRIFHGNVIPVCNSTSGVYEYILYTRVPSGYFIMALSENSWQRYENYARVEINLENLTRTRTNIIKTTRVKKKKIITRVFSWISSGAPLHGAIFRLNTR